MVIWVDLMLEWMQVYWSIAHIYKIQNDLSI